MGIFCSDFETTTQTNYEIENETRVWGYATIEVGNYKNFTYGNNLDSFMMSCKNSYENDTHYFHNLAFDGFFIIYWLERNNFTWVKDRKEFKDNTYTTLITDTGVFYSLEVCFKKKGKKINKVLFLDSLKLLNFSVDVIGKNFGLDVLKIGKEEEFYNKYRERNHELTEEEIAYMRNDVEVVAKAIETLRHQKMEKNTIASCSMFYFKSLFKKGEFEYYFPILDLETDEAIRHAYKGGWTYCDKRFSNKSIGEGLVFDVNSLYPWAMRYCRFPIGDPIYFKGKYKQDDNYDLYIQLIECQFELKEGHLPTIQKKRSYGRFNDSEYLTTSKDKEGNDEPVTLCLTSVDLKLFLEHYTPTNLEYIEGYKFKSCANIFNEYIDYWIQEKINAELNGNKAMRQIAKLMLNSLYGKFGLNPHAKNKHVEYDSLNDIVHLKNDEEEEIRKPIYIPMACFITAYAREKTIRTAQSVYDRFMYADTDSIHINGLDIPKDIEVHKTKLGAWKNELVFKKAKYLRQKCYLEYGKEPNTEDEYEWKVTCAGMPKGVYPTVLLQDFKTSLKKSYKLRKPNSKFKIDYPDLILRKFKLGTIYDGKLQHKKVRGGVLLVKTTFEIKKQL